MAWLEGPTRSPETFWCNAIPWERDRQTKEWWIRCGHRRVCTEYRIRTFVLSNKDPCLALKELSLTTENHFVHWHEILMKTLECLLNMSTLTYHVVPCRDDEFLLLVMSGSALLVVMLRSRNRSSRISEIQWATMTWVCYHQGKTLIPPGVGFFSPFLSAGSSVPEFQDSQLQAAWDQGFWSPAHKKDIFLLHWFSIVMDSLKHIVFIIPHIVLPCQNETPTSTEMLVAVLHYGQRCRVC